MNTFVISLEAVYLLAVCTLSLKPGEHFKNCLPPSQKFLTPEETRDLCVMCLGEEQVHLVLEGSENFTMPKLRLCLSLFSREEGQASVPRGSGPTPAEAQQKLSSWGSQVELAEWLQKGLHLSKTQTASSSPARDPDTLSLESSDPNSTLLGCSRQNDDEEIDVVGDDNESVSTQS